MDSDVRNQCGTANSVYYLKLLIIIHYNNYLNPKSKLPNMNVTLLDFDSAVILLSEWDFIRMKFIVLSCGN